jgi:phage virion morphogenesis protein
MALGVRVQVSDDSAVIAALARLALDGDDKRALLDEVGITLAENARLRFSDQVSPDGTPWKPSFRAIAQGGETLRDTGLLVASITHQLLSADAVEYGTNVPYATALHYGAEIKATNAPYLRFKIPGGGWARKKSVTLPAREFLGLSNEDEEQVVDIIDHFLRAAR